MRIGYFLASEEFSPSELLAQARMAQDAGFAGLWISDHYHPWNDAQGHSPCVWPMIGALSQAAPQMKVTTAVTCPTVRIHPAIVAQAAATCAILLEGRFALGLGSGEALNEHILGNRWPHAEERRAMLEEAVHVIRCLWQGGMQSHRGVHYRVENARIYDLPEETPPILLSGFGPKATKLAARVGDGYCTVGPDAEEVQRFRAESRTPDPIVAGGLKVCWGEDENAARATARRLWPNEALGGELAQVLPTPAHLEAACEPLTEEAVAAEVPCGPDLDMHIEKIRRYEEAGFDELYVQQIGADHERFFELYAREVVPHFNDGEAAALAGSATAR
jgi:G6PDH family F420-dependent oxidoreductase